MFIILNNLIKFIINYYYINVILLNNIKDILKIDSKEIGKDSK